MNKSDLSGQKLSKMFSPLSNTFWNFSKIEGKDDFF